MESAQTKVVSSYLKSILKNDTETRRDFLSKYAIEQLEKLDIFKTSKKLYERLKMVVTNENLYEADQLYKTIHFRCMTNNLIDDGLSLLFNGIIFFADKNSLQCAYDLGKAFLETLKKSSKTIVDQTLRTQIKLIHESLGKCRSLNDEERSEFSVAVLKWSSGLYVKNKLDINNEESIRLNYQNVFGHYDIHTDFAINYWKERNYVQARYHFLHSLDAKSFAYMLVECHLNFGYASEYDLFLAQAVFQYLTLRNLKSADEFFRIFTHTHPMVQTSKLNQNFYESPIINFMYFLIETLKERKFKEYKEIYKAYKPCLEKDSSFRMYLDRIEEYYFDVKTNKGESGGIFSNLMRMLTSNSTNEQKPKSSNQRINESDQEDSHSVGDLEDNDLLD